MKLKKKLTSTCMWQVITVSLPYVLYMYCNMSSEHGNACRNPFLNDLGVSGSNSSDVLSPLSLNSVITGSLWKMACLPWTDVNIMGTGLAVVSWRHFTSWIHTSLLQLNGGEYRLCNAPWACYNPTGLKACTVRCATEHKRPAFKESPLCIHGLMIFN